jgi:hypothetical protein
MIVGVPRRGGSCVSLLRLIGWPRLLVAGIPARGFVLEQVADLRDYLAQVRTRGIGGGVAFGLAAAGVGRDGGAGGFALVRRDRVWIADVPQRVLAVPGARFDSCRDHYLGAGEVRGSGPAAAFAIPD